jgi:hypothetical protein
MRFQVWSKLKARWKGKKNEKWEFFHIARTRAHHEPCHWRRNNAQDCHLYHQRGYLQGPTLHRKDANYLVGLFNLLENCAALQSRFDSRTCLTTCSSSPSPFWSHYSGNFIDLANSGFYDGIHFHRCVPGTCNMMLLALSSRLRGARPPPPTARPPPNRNWLGETTTWSTWHRRVP